MRPDGLYIRLAIFIAGGLLLWYAYYNIITVPQNEITTLESELTEQKKVPTKIVKNINKADANRTQKEINDVKEENTTLINSNRGVLFF